MKQIIGGALALALFSATAWAAGTDSATSEWFRSLKQPVSEFSCCSEADCHPTPARFIEGVWWARTSEGKDGEFVPVPKEIIVTGKASPFVRDGEGLAVLCESEYAGAYTKQVTGSMGSTVFLYCYVIPPNFS